MSLASFSSKGQIVVPQEIRKKHGIKTGTRVSVFSRGREIVIKPIEENIEDRLFGVFKDVNLLGDLRKEREKERRREREKELLPLLWLGKG